MPNSKNVKKLRKSKKYAQGSRHMTGGGEIEIIDRYVVDGVIYLKYWHFEENREIENKEVNVNRLIHDYKQKQKAESFEKLSEVAGGLPSPEDVNTLAEVHKVCQEATEKLTLEIADLKEDIEHLTNLVNRLLRQSK